MKFILIAFSVLTSVSAHASYADCTVTAVFDGALQLAQGQGVTINDNGAIIGSTIYRNAVITEQTNGTRRADRVIDRATTIEVISDIRTNEGALYVTPASGVTTEVATLICR